MSFYAKHKTLQITILHCQALVARMTMHDISGKKTDNFDHICTNSSHFVIFLDFQSTKQGLSLVDSWSRGLD